MISTGWHILLIKGIFKKKLILGPASAGPFEGTPFLTRLMLRLTLIRFIDLILVREPISAVHLWEINVRNYVVATDIALLDIKRENKTLNLWGVRSAVGFVPASLRYALTREEYVISYIEAHSKLIDYLANVCHYDVVLRPVSMEDSMIVNEILLKVQNRDKAKVIISSNVDIYELVVKKLELLV